jgi:hypothetical protein
MKKKEEDEFVDLINSIIKVKQHIQKLFLGDIPEEVKEHIRKGHKERLLALRAFIDSAISRLEEKETESKKPGKVNIE